MSYRDRVLELRRVRAADILGAPWNWRTHPPAQVEALAGSIKELGFFDPLDVRELPDGRLELIDGHARRDLLHDRIGPDTLVPCVVTDLSEDEAKKANLLKDPLAAMAEADAEKMAALLQEVTTDNPAIETLLADMAGEDDPAGPSDGPGVAIPETYAVYLECESEEEQGVIIADLMANNLAPRAMTVPKITREAKEPQPVALKTGDRKIVRECGIERTPRVVQVEGIFDLSPAQKAKREWVVNLDLNKPWQVGLIVGPSGSGKSTIARELFGDRLVGGWPWPEGGALVDGFPESMTASEITGLLSSVGLSSPPSWVKPFHVLSNGEQFRANLARTLAERPDVAVVDEFTSVVDRTVARVGSAAVAKCVRATGRRFVAVTCHYDVEDWLQPDWTYDVAAGRLTWRSLRQRPEIHLQVRKAGTDLWPLFGRHHYLNASVHRGSRCFLAEVEGQPAAFVAVLHSPGRVSFFREHRCVCLPDFQGVGIGNAVSEFVAGVIRATGKGYRSTTSHPSMIAHRSRSPLWRTCRAPSQNTGRQTGAAFGHLNDAQAFDRLTASFEYVGPVRADEARRLGVISGQSLVNPREER